MKRVMNMNGPESITRPKPTLLLCHLDAVCRVEKLLSGKLAVIHAQSGVSSLLMLVDIQGALLPPTWGWLCGGTTSSFRLLEDDPWRVPIVFPCSSAKAADPSLGRVRELVQGHLHPVRP